MAPQVTIDLHRLPDIDLHHSPSLTDDTGMCLDTSFGAQNRHHGELRRRQLPSVNRHGPPRAALR